MTHICVGNPTIICSDNGLSAPSHYLYQCWNIGNWTFRNQLQWYFNRNSNIFLKLHLKTSSAKWRLFCLCLNELMLNYMKQLGVHWCYSRLPWRKALVLLVTTKLASWQLSVFSVWLVSWIQKQNVTQWQCRILTDILMISLGIH